MLCLHFESVVFVDKVFLIFCCCLGWHLKRIEHAVKLVSWAHFAQVDDQECGKLKSQGNLRADLGKRRNHKKCALNHDK